MLRGDRVNRYLVRWMHCGTVHYLYTDRRDTADLAVAALRMYPDVELWCGATRLRVGH